MSGGMRRYTSKKYTYTPAQGVKSDFETLLQKFTETGTVRFQSFAEIWKEMKFSKYCAGRQTLREVREFVEECLKIATQFWLPPSSFQVRAGALYLLYGLYNFQISAPKAKIRVTPENWKSVLEFQQLCREQQHLDINYVFQKLKLDRAFQFVATTSEFNPFDTRDDSDGRALPDSLKDDESLLSELYSSQVLNQLAAVHDQYHKMKVSLAVNDDGEELDTSLNIINNDLIQNIYRTLQSHRDKQSHTVGGQQQSTSQDSTSEGEEKYTSLSVKGALKKKAFKTYVRGQRGRGRGKVKPVRFTDTVTSLQDPKVNVCGRLKGRAPKIDIFGRDEDVVTGPGVPPSIGVIDMPSILGLEQDKPVKKKSLKNTIKQERKRGRKKKVVSDYSEEETESKPDTKDIKSTPSDDEWMDVEDPMHTDDSSVEFPSKKGSGKSSKKAARKASVASDEASGSTKKPASKVKKAVKRSASRISGDDNFENVSDSSPVKTPKKTARMSVGNTDLLELKKLKSAEKSSRPRKPSSSKKLKKSSESVSEVHEETVVENKDNSDNIPTGPKKKHRRKKSLKDSVKDTSKTSNSAKDADGETLSEIQSEKKFNSSVKKNSKVAKTISDKKETPKIQSESKKSKRKLNPSDSDSVGGKKPKKQSEDAVTESEAGKTEKVTAAKLVAKSLGKKSPKTKKNTSAEKGKKGQKTANLNKKTEDIVKNSNKVIKSEEPSAQEKLNKKIAKRIKDKRLSQN